EVDTVISIFGVPPFEVVIEGIPLEESSQSGWFGAGRGSVVSDPKPFREAIALTTEKAHTRRPAQEGPPSTEASSGALSSSQSIPSQPPEYQMHILSLRRPGLYRLVSLRDGSGKPGRVQNLAPDSDGAAPVDFPLRVLRCPEVTLAVPPTETGARGEFLPVPEADRPTIASN
ncbi:hypothetical protein HDU93_004285, partial [Gonapodya sp. JEL0774]